MASERPVTAAVMVSRKNVLTTGEVARICSVAPRTVSKWFDSGQLRGYRIPGSKDRRIPIEHLIRFMRVHGIPLNGLDGETRRLLVLDRDTALWVAIGQAMEDAGRYELTSTGTAFEAGAAAQEIRPHVIIIDVTLPDVVSEAIALRVRGMTDLQDACLIGVGSGLTEAQGQTLLQCGFQGYLSKPFNVRSLINLMDELILAGVG